MQFIPEEELAEVETGEKQEQRKSRFWRLLHQSRRDSGIDKVEVLDKIKFHELLALNLPDWYLVLLGVIFAALLGALFPIVALIYSGFLEVGACLTSSDSFVVYFC